MSTLSIAMIVVLWFLLGAFVLLWRYRRTMEGCLVHLRQKEACVRIGTLNVEYYVKRIEQELPNYQLLWPMLFGFAVGDTVLAWLILPHTETPNVLSIGTACLIATVITRALTIDSEWAIELLAKFNDRTLMANAARRGLEELRPDLEQALGELEQSKADLEKITKEFDEELEKIIKSISDVEALKKDKRDLKKDKRD